MTGIDIITPIHDYCVANDIVVLMGNEEYQNYETGVYNLEQDQLVMGIMPFKVIPNDIKNGVESSNSFPGRLLLGRKLESTGTISCLDETYQQKWVNRLAFLNEKLKEIIKDIACIHELDIKYTLNTDMINMYSGNIDFVYSDVTFTK